jgi:RNA polymerase sigma-70 factor (ECF subfamily)
MTRAQLMERARSGDREAFRALFEEIGPLITRFLRRRMGDRSEIEDVCQEVAIAVYRSRHTYDSTRPFEPWLFAIVRKVSFEHLRRSRRQTGSEVQTDKLEEVRADAGASLAVELRQALERLPPAQIEALNLTKVLGLSVEEASRRAGTSVGSMKVRVHRAYEALRRSLIR